VLALHPAPARAQHDLADAVEPTFGDAVARRPDWLAGVVLERAVGSFVGKRALDDQLFGLGATYFAAGRYGLHGRLLVSPNVQRTVDTRGLAALGLRTRARVLGVDTYVGVGAHVEARLRTHYWLAYVAPMELGVTAWQRGSFRFEIFLGARGVVAGDLIDFFLIDPNGVDNEAANEALRGRKSRPWEAYLSFVFARVM
jgi:hypothetical protein